MEKKMKVKSNICEVCPFCNTGMLDYDSFKMDGEMGYYEWHCTNCGHDGEEWYQLEFVGHNVIDEDGNSVEIEDNMIESEE